MRWRLLITTDLRAAYIGVSAGFWMNLQLRWDLYHAQKSEAKTLEAIKVHTVSTSGVAASQIGRMMKYFTLIYYVVENFVSQRAAFRQEHLRLAREAKERGELLLAGALGDPADRALLVFYDQDGAAAEAFARSDPYVLNGLVTRWEVQPWAVVIGN